MCEDLYDLAEETGAKVILTDLKEVRGNTTSIRKGYKGNNLTIKNFYLDVTPCFLCSKLFHKSMMPFWEKATINTNQAEDMCMMLPLVSYLENDSDLYYHNHAYYYYYRHDDSNSADDYFIDDYCIIEYLNSLRYIMHNHNSDYSTLVAYYCMNAIYWGLGNSKRVCFKADYLEFLRAELLPYVIGNHIFSRFNNLITYLSCEIIPKRLVYTNLTNRILSEEEQICIASWKKYARDYDIVELNFKNMDLSSAPACIAESFEKNLQFAEEYIRMKYIYENGGIALSLNMKLNAPLGQQRVDKVFFGYEDDSIIGVDIYGACKRNEVLGRILDSYTSDSIFNDAEICLKDRIQIILQNEYGLIPKGVECYLKKDTVKLYACNTLYRRLDSKSISYPFTQLEYLAELNNKLVVDMINSYDNKNTVIQSSMHREIQSLKEEICTLKTNKTQLEKELDLAREAYQNIITSSSWRITSPIRKLLDTVKN